MKRLGFLLGIVILVLALTAGYTLWLHNNTMTTYNITSPAVMLNLSNYAHDEVDINFTGNIYQAKLATNLMFSGTLSIGDVTYHLSDKNGLELKPLKGDDYHGSFVSGEGELASIIINADFTKGFIKYWHVVDAESDDDGYNRSTLEPQTEDDTLTEIDMTEIDSTETGSSESAAAEYIASERYVIFPYKAESDLELKRLIKEYENEFMKDYNPINE